MKEIKIIETIEDIAKALFGFAIAVAFTLFAALPFILIENQDSPKFWQSLGWFGMYLFGVATFIGGIPVLRRK